MISLKKLRSLSLATFALCFMSFTTEAMAQRCPSKCDVIYRTDAIVLSESLLGEFMMGFTAAVNETDPTARAALVTELTNLLTTPFTVTFNLEGIAGPFTLTATNYATLLTTVQIFATQSVLTTNLIGNLNFSNYTKLHHHLRSLDFNFQSYGLSTNLADTSTTVSSFNGNAHVVETSCDVFQIETITLSVITDAVIPTLIP